jgi:hypothetical protein
VTFADRYNVANARVHRLLDSPRLSLAPYSPSVADPDATADLLRRAADQLDRLSDVAYARGITAAPGAEVDALSLPSRLRAVADGLAGRAA